MKISPTKEGSEKALKFWDGFAPAFDWMTRYSEWRWAPYKRDLFSRASGNILMAGAGTGRDFPFFPEKKRITAIDFSAGMLLRAKRRLDNTHAHVTLLKGDLQSLSFSDGSFDSCITSCILCSVADPAAALKEIYRILKHGGSLLMFEHTISGSRIFNAVLTIMNQTPGPDLTRDTVANVESSGFKIVSIDYIFMDIVKTIEAKKI